MTTAVEVNESELRRYAQRIGERWQLQRALVGGARIADARGAGFQRERGAEFVVVLVSEGFDGVPWLERVHQAENLWDAGEMGARADVHCYTPVEFERKREALAVVRRVADAGFDILDPAASLVPVEEAPAPTRDYEPPDGVAPA